VEQLSDDPPDHHHRNILGGWARGAIFGISDGLVTNVSLILGVAGAHPGGGVVRLTGLAGMVAGAFSMGAGELVSVQAQRELLQRELDVERTSLRTSPDWESKELVAIYEDRGIDPGLARDLVARVMEDPELALEVHAREELGIHPGSMGSPWQAAVASFLAFAVGAFLPLIPWLVGSGTAAILASVVIGAVASLAVGAGLARLTGRSPVRSALRQLGVAAVAAGVTFGIGRAVGVGVS
jgi:VIT1/CCC1 family predicted Fe2+/Mn2+ transporter